MPHPKTYLDHAATTPMLPQARDAWLEGARLWANPSSPHAAGRAARSALEDARARVASALGWTGEVIFTSGASEALAIGLGRAVADRRIASAVEHDAVFRAAPAAEVLPVSSGAVDLRALDHALAQPGKAIVAVQSVNSETGTVFLKQGDATVAQRIRAAGGLLLADCSQSAGKFALPDADMIVLSAHKLGGPIGIGALLVRDFAMLSPTGGQERGYRAGTENLPGALAFAAAVEAGGLQSWRTTEEQRLAFRAQVLQSTSAVEPGEQCSYIFALTARSISATAMLIRMDAAGFAISAGSACSSGTLKQSRVLEEFGINADVARRTVRVSLGWSTTGEELDAFAAAWAKANA